MELQDDLKALSIRQPWATFIVDRLKDIENRTWRTNYRGEYYVHASSTFASGFSQIVKEVNKHFNLEYPLTKSEFKTGGIIGSAELINCVSKHDSYWAENNPGVKYFILENGKRFDDLIPCSGRTYFFKPERKKSEQENLF